MYRTMALGVIEARGYSSPFFFAFALADRTRADAAAACLARAFRCFAVIFLPVVKPPRLGLLHAKQETDRFVRLEPERGKLNLWFAAWTSPCLSFQVQ